MFGDKRSPVPAGSTDQVETIISQGTQVKGSLSADATIQVDGQVDGELSSKGTVLIGATGEIKAQIRARSATIAGTVYGNADVIDKLELTSTAKFFGDIKTGQLKIAEGAVFKGSCEMRHGNDLESNRK